MFKKTLDGLVPSPLYEAVRACPPVPRGGKRLILGYGTGRCGMNWFSRVLMAHANAHGGCERFPEFEVFYRYCSFHKLPMDMGGFFELLRRTASRDWSQGDVSVLYSPYFDFGVTPLAKALEPDAAFLHIRKPEDAINSMSVKGWYLGDYIRDEAGLVPGPQPLQAPFVHHNFGRVVPADRFDWWRALSQIGRIAWFYVEANTRMLEQHRALGDKAWTVRLVDVDQNYDYYRHLAARLDLSPALSREDFLALKDSTPNKGRKKRGTDDWSARERKDFEEIVGPFYDTYDALKTTGM